MSRFSGISNASAKYDTGRIKIHNANKIYKIRQIKYDELLSVIVYNAYNIQNASDMIRIPQCVLEQNIESGLIEYQ